MLSTATPRLKTRRLLMVPLKVSHAAEMVDVLGDTRLYRFTGGDPPSLDELESRYRFQTSSPPRAGEVWHNWILRDRKTGEPIGFVQATVTSAGADVAWLVGVGWQGRGLATEAATEMCRWLVAGGTRSLTAHIHPDHVASQRVAAAVGMEQTDEVDDDGEVVWASADADPRRRPAGTISPK